MSDNAEAVRNASIEDIRAEIQRLETIEKEYMRPARVEKRHKRRAQLLGDMIMQLVMEGTAVRLPDFWWAKTKEIAGEEAWLFDGQALGEDGLEFVKEQDSTTALRKKAA